MELRAADKLEDFGNSHYDRRLKTVENGVQSDGTQVREQTIEWIANSAQSIFRQTWAGSR
jgi:hypothetical protein